MNLVSKLLLGKDLSVSEARGWIGRLLDDSIPFHEAKSFLLLLSKKGETADEILGCQQAIAAREGICGKEPSGLIDTCGTGGDGRASLNISTLVALVVATAGGKVAKHGNRALSSKCGSSDLMEMLGYPLDVSSKRSLRCLHRYGFAYFHAPFFHPAFAKIQPLRRQIGTPTIFNLLGPLLNPLCPDYQLIGISRPERLALYADVLRRLRRKSVLLCHSADGLDEISSVASTEMMLIEGSKVKRLTLNPKKFSLSPFRERDLTIRSKKDALKKALDVLRGGAPAGIRDLIAINAACALWISKIVPTVKDGLEGAREILDEGLAFNHLKLILREVQR